MTGASKTLPSTTAAMLLILTSILSLPLATSAQDLLTQIHVITRHGSRYPLRKDANDLSDETPGGLTAFGQKQMYDQGVWIRDTYASNETGFLEHYQASKMRLESSALERTIVSANSLALGLFPGPTRDPTGESLLPVDPANIPVMTHDSVNDIYLRAFDKCPTLHDRLQNLYASNEWQQMETDNDQFLAQLAQITYFAPFENQNGIVPLEEVWNVYDMISVAKTECTEGHEELATCQAIANGVDLARNVLTDDEWLKLTSLAHYAELMKYGIQTAGKLIGINVLLEIVNRMKGGGSVNSNNEELDFSLFSGHYATILGVFAALEKTFFAEQVIPHYAAALIFTVTQHVNTTERYFKITYRGDDRPNSRAVDIDLVNICGNPLVCPVSALEQYLGGWNTERWCEECANTGANQCLTGKDGSGKDVVETKDPAENNNGDDDDDYPAEYGFILGLLVGLIAVVITFFMQRRFHKQAMEEQRLSLQAAQNNIPPAHYDNNNSHQMQPQNSSNQLNGSQESQPPPPPMGSPAPSSTMGSPPPANGVEPRSPPSQNTTSAAATNEDVASSVGDPEII